MNFEFLIPNLQNINSKFGSNKNILLKAKRDSPVISHALTLNRRIIHVHEFVAREISLLWSQNLSLWLSASSVQPLQAHVEHPQKKTRPQALASFAWISERSVVAGKDAEEPCSTYWAYSSSLESPFSSGHASTRVPTSRLACASRATGPSDRRALLSFQPTSLGAVFDGVETLSPKPRSFPGPSAVSWSGGDRLLVANHQHHSGQSAQAHSSLGVRPDPGYHLLGRAQRLGLAAVSFSPYQPAARQPGKAKEKSRRQKHA